MVKSGQTIAGQFTVIGEGGLEDATGTPTGTLLVNGVANAATVTITHPGTGIYKWACPLPTLSAGDVVQILPLAILSGAPVADVQWSDVVDTKRTSDLVDAAMITSQAVRDAMKLAATSGTPAANSIDAKINATATLGAGAITWPYTVADITGVPIANVDVWVCTDVLGDNVVANGTTDTLGVVTFYLDAGTYYFFREKSGFNFVNPDSEAVA